MNDDCYICQLSEIEQEIILSKARTVFERLAYEIDIEVELQNVLYSRVKEIKHIWEDR